MRLTFEQKCWLLVLVCWLGTVANIVLVAAHTRGQLWGFFACLVAIPVFASMTAVLIAAFGETWLSKPKSPVLVYFADIEGSVNTEDDACDTDPNWPVASAPRITGVTYRRLRSFGNYENEAVEATCHVPDGVDPREALHATQLWVADQLKLGENRDALQGEVDRLESEKAGLARDIEQARVVHAKAKKFLEENKLELWGDPPF